MSDLNELQRYITQGSIAEELIREQDESFSENKETNSKVQSIGEKSVNRNDNLSYAIRKVLSEALLSEYPMEGPINPEANCPEYVRKSQKLISVISDLLWKIKDSYRDSQELGDEFADIAKSAYVPALDLAIEKLYTVWSRKEEAPEPENSVEIVAVSPGDSVVSPQGIEYKVESRAAGKFALKNKIDNKPSIVDESILLSGKWSIRRK